MSSKILMYSVACVIIAVGIVATAYGFLQASAVKELRTELLNTKSTLLVLQERREFEDELERQKDEWFSENSEVDVSFNRERRGEVTYVIDYLHRNAPVGDCALAWSENVVCWDSNKLSFPVR